MTESLTFQAASIPHIVFVLGLLVALAATLLIRGDAFRRSSVAAMVVSMLPWGVGNALMLCLDDPQAADALAHFTAGSWSLIGPTAVIFLLTSNSRLDQHRLLVLAISVLGIVGCILTWSTDLMIDGADELSWGGLHPAAGPLYVLPALLLAVAIAIAAYISLPRRGQRNISSRRRYLLTVGIVAVTSAVDPILAGYGITPTPFVFVPGSIAVILLLRAIFKHDLLHSRGFDSAAAYELGMFVALVPLAVVITWASTEHELGGGPIMAMLLLVPIFGGAQAAALMVRKHISTMRTRVSAEADQAVEKLAAKSLNYRRAVELAEGVVEVLHNHSRLTEVRLWVMHSKKRLRPAGGDRKSGIELDVELQHWLSDHRLPLHNSDLPLLRLHGQREPLEQLFAALKGGVIQPLADRDRLVGLVVAAPPPYGRMLADGELHLLREVGRTAAKSLTFISLFVEAEERIEIDKELEVAAAVQYGRTLEEVTHEFTHCQVIGHYTPAAQFGGDWWSAYELSDERVLVVIGDVTGRGVPAALVSSTALAACQTAQALQGASCEVLSLLELLNTAVRTVGGDQYEMTSFALLIDWDSRRITYANGGHRFPYLVRPDEDGGATLHPLISRGTHLGVAEPVLQASTMDIEQGDYLVLFSDAAVEARDPSGRAYGDKKLQQVLKRDVARAGNRACEVIRKDILNHCGDRAPDDDLTLVIVRLGPEK